MTNAIVGAARENGFARHLPDVSLATLITALIGGVAATIAWEFWARGVTPLWIGGPLEPAGLVQSVFGLKDRTVAEAIHFFVGLVGYPLGYLLAARPIAKLVTPGLPWWMVSAAYGVALWVYALYFMAHLAAGFPAFLGWGAITWASLVGHVLYAVALGFAVQQRLK